MASTPIESLNIKDIKIFHEQIITQPYRVMHTLKQMQNESPLPSGLYVCIRSYIKNEFDDDRIVKAATTCVKGRMYAVKRLSRNDPFLPDYKIYKYMVKEIAPPDKKNYTVCILRLALFEQHFKRFC